MEGGGGSGLGEGAVETVYSFQDLEFGVVGRKVVEMVEDEEGEVFIEGGLEVLGRVGGEDCGEDGVVLEFTPWGVGEPLVDDMPVNQTGVIMHIESVHSEIEVRTESKVQGDGELMAIQDLIVVGAEEGVQGARSRMPADLLIEKGLGEVFEESVAARIVNEVAFVMVKARLARDTRVTLWHV